MSNSKNSVSIIPPRHQNVLNESHVEIITSVLEQICGSDSYISRAELYSKLKGPLNLTMSEKCFCHALSELFKEGKFPGFTTRRGVHGGIYRQQKIDSQEFSSEERVSSSRIKVVLSQVIINDLKFYVSIPEYRLTRLILKVLDGSLDISGNVTVNDNKFKVDNAEILEKYIKSFDDAAS
jgi:hypothetical protein